MLEIWIYTILSVTAISLISLVGVLTIAINTKQLKDFLHYFVSFSAGALFGDAFIHLLPQVVTEFGFVLEISIFLMLGIVFSFIIEKFIRWRHCHIPTDEHHPHPFAFMNLIGDAVHNFIDGLIIGTSYLVSIPVGIATTIAVALHEIPQEIGDFGVLIHGGFSRSKALLLNFLTALTAIAGAVVALVIGSFVGNITLYIIPFAAGIFIYIAGSDLIPELHKEDDAVKSIIELVVFVLGIIVMLALLLIE